METTSLRLLQVALPEADRRVIRRTFSDIWRDITFIGFETQGEAGAFLMQEGLYAGEARPDIIFLDLKEGEERTLEFLQRVKGKPKLREIPFLLVADDFSHMARREDLAFYSHLLLARPLSRTEIRKAAQQLVDFWMGFQEFVIAEG